MSSRINGLVVLADIPELSDERKPQSRITVARIGTYKDARYGTFQIDKTDFEGWQKNLGETFGNRIAVDFDHSSDRGRGTEAAAWIVGLERQGKDLVADVKWTPKGAAAVRDGAYAYFSPTFVNNYKNERGEDRGRALIGGALTNRPVLRELPTLSLSKDEFEGIELAKVGAKVRKKTATLKGKGKPEFPMPDKLHAHLALQFVGRSLKKGNITPADAAKIRARANKMLGKKGNGKTQAARDSRGQMDLKELAKLLELDESADLATVLTAVVTLDQPPADPPSPSRTGPGSASARPTESGRTDGNGPKGKKGKKNKPTTMALDENGHVILSAEQMAKLLADANAGASAAVSLAQERFDRAWQKALSEGRVAPSQEETVKALHELDPALAIKTLDSFVPIVPVKPTGSGEGAGPGGPAPLGMDEDRFQLHQQAKALAAEKRKADPKLDKGEAYVLAAIEIEERKFTLENPGI